MDRETLARPIATFTDRWGELKPRGPHTKKAAPAKRNPFGFQSLGSSAMLLPNTPN